MKCFNFTLMANTDITLVNDGGTYVPSTQSVNVVSGNTISFATNDGSAVLLFFSPGATSVLTPKPAGAFPIAAGGRAVFSFSSSAPGAYSMYCGSTPNSAPANFPSAVSNALFLEVSSSVVPSFNEKMGTGH
jgi:plastocyanin